MFSDAYINFFMLDIGRTKVLFIKVVKHLKQFINKTFGVNTCD